MKKEKTKEKPKVVFEDEFMTVFENNGRRIVKFRSEMKGKFTVELEAEENSKASQFSVSSNPEKPIMIRSNDKLDIVGGTSLLLTVGVVKKLIVQEAGYLKLEQGRDVVVENFRSSLEAYSEEQLVAVILSSQGKLISLPEYGDLSVHLLEKHQKGGVGFPRVCLSFGKTDKDKYSCNVRSNFELKVSNTPKVVLLDGFHGQAIVAEKASGKNAGYFQYVSGLFGKITEKFEKKYPVFQISDSKDLEVHSPLHLSVYTNEVNFDYSSQSVALKCKKLIPFDFNFNQAGDEIAFNVDKFNGFVINSYKNHLKEFTCSYDQDRGALVLATPLLALDSYLKTKETEFLLKDVDEQKLNLVMRSSRNDINVKSDKGSEKNRLHINLDGLMPMLTVRGDKVTSSNINMNIRGRDNYVEATVISEDQNKASMFTVDQLRGKSSMSNT